MTIDQILKLAKQGIAFFIPKKIYSIPYAEMKKRFLIFGKKREQPKSSV